MKLAVVLPSRGMVYSKTVEELYRELESMEGSFRVFWSHGRPIPDCFNIPTEEALKGDYDYVLYVEEDMVLPEGILNRMLAKVDYALACDYPVGGTDGGTVMYDPNMTPFFTGCGLLLVKTNLLRSMPKPIWRTDVRWVPRAEGGWIRFTLSVDDSKHYGQQDVAFGLRLYANGLPIEIMDETIGQRRMVKKGKQGVNNGQHTIVEKMNVNKRVDLTNIKHVDFKPEIIIDGRIVKVSEEQLKRIKNPVFPDYIRSGRAIFDIPEHLKEWMKIDYAR